MNRPPNDLRAVFLDLDDTLCIYMPVAIASRKLAFELIRERAPHLSIAQIDEAYRVEFDRMVAESKPGGKWRARYLSEGATPRDETMRRLVVRLGLEEPELGLAVSTRYHELRRAALYLHDDAMPVLLALKPRYHVGVITNGPADIQREELRDLGLERVFDSVCIEGELGVGKPDPAIFHQALAGAGVSAAQAVFVGNSLGSDVRGAKEAGIFAVWINREAESPPDANHCPDAEFRNLSDFAVWLGLNPVENTASSRGKR